MRVDLFHPGDYLVDALVDLSLVVGSIEFDPILNLLRVRHDSFNGVLTLTSSDCR